MGFDPIGIAAGAAGIAGSWIDYNKQKHQFEDQMGMSESQFRENQKFAKEQFEWQKKLAEMGIQMRIEDARKAGISPLAAMGSQGFNFSPVSIGTTAMGATGFQGGSMAGMGQDISRAMMSTRDVKEREMNSLTLQDNVLRTQANKNQAEADFWASKAKEVVSPPGTGPGVPDPYESTEDTVTMRDAISGRNYDVPSPFFMKTLGQSLAGLPIWFAKRYVQRLAMYGQINRDELRYYQGLISQRYRNRGR